LRALAVTGAKRSPSAPDIPTVAETALPGFESETWFGIVAPAATPRDIVAKLNAAARQAVNRADTRQRYTDLGMTIRSDTPEEFDAYIKAEIVKWSKVIKDANVQALD
jgi:tripartite-type tricarboxylate transporter receptor subunit TctC